MRHLRSVLDHATVLLATQEVDSPRLSAELLLAKALHIERHDLIKLCITDPQYTIPAEAIPFFDTLISRRAAGEPAAYIVGEKEFFSLSFRVTADTLIPRPETELLVETALYCAQKYTNDYSSTSQTAPSLPAHFPSKIFADLGTGSGCIAISLAKELPGWSGLALDASPAALAVAQSNATRHQAMRLSFVVGNFHHLPLAQKSYALIVSNPPYVSAAEYATISHEVRDYEPAQALVPQKELQRDQIKTSHGLTDIEAICRHAAKALAPKGYLVLEVGHLQGQVVLNSLPSSKWTEQEIIQDLSKHDRIIKARLR